MNKITQTMLYRQALIAYAAKYGVMKATIRYRTNRKRSSSSTICAAGTPTPSGWYSGPNSVKEDMPDPFQVCTDSCKSEARWLWSCRITSIFPSPTNRCNIPASAGRSTLNSFQRAASWEGTKAWNGSSTPSIYHLFFSILYWLILVTMVQCRKMANKSNNN